MPRLPNISNRFSTNPANSPKDKWSGSNSTDMIRDVLICESCYCPNYLFAEQQPKNP